jgi:hypothetical protein
VATVKTLNLDATTIYGSFGALNWLSEFNLPVHRFGHAWVVAQGQQGGNARGDV